MIDLESFSPGYQCSNGILSWLSAPPLRGDGNDNDGAAGGDSGGGGGGDSGGDPTVAGEGGDGDGGSDGGGDGDGGGGGGGGGKASILRSLQSSGSTADPTVWHFGEDIVGGTRRTPGWLAAYGGAHAEANRGAANDPLNSTDSRAPRLAMLTLSFDVPVATVGGIAGVEILHTYTSDAAALDIWCEKKGQIITNLEC